MDETCSINPVLANCLRCFKAYEYYTSPSLVRDHFHPLSHSISFDSAQCGTEVSWASASGLRAPAEVMSSSNLPNRSSQDLGASVPGLCGLWAAEDPMAQSLNREATERNRNNSTSKHLQEGPPHRSCYDEPSPESHSYYVTTCRFSCHHGDQKGNGALAKWRYCTGKTFSILLNINSRGWRDIIDLIVTQKNYRWYMITVNCLLWINCCWQYCLLDDLP